MSRGMGALGLVPRDGKDWTKPLSGRQWREVRTKKQKMAVSGWTQLAGRPAKVTSEERHALHVRALRVGR
jgi:hypothetical protein